MTQSNELTRREKLATSKGFSRIPHPLADIMYSGQLNQRELRVLLVIIRMTLGFDRRETEIGGAMFSELTGIPIKKIWKILDRLHFLDIIEREARFYDKSGNRSANAYSISRKYLGDLRLKK
jgi:phage replication O-like protein O